MAVGREGLEVLWYAPIATGSSCHKLHARDYTATRLVTLIGDLHLMISNYVGNAYKAKSNEKICNTRPRSTPCEVLWDEQFIYTKGVEARENINERES